MKTHRAAFAAIGTDWEIELPSAISDRYWQRLMEQIRQRIDVFDRAYSRFRADSLITQMAQKAGSYVLPPDGYALLQFYEQLYKATDGKVTPLIGQVMADAGYDADYTFNAKSLQTPPQWEEVITYTGQTLNLAAPALLDFGAAGKGYLIDIVGDMLRAAGFESYVINAGGDMLHRSNQADEFKVGLENPFDVSEVIGTLRLSNQSLCASAGSKRKWHNFHHIIDPVTLQSTDEVMATWVLADTTMLADGLASALFFTEPAHLLKQFSFSYALLTKDMSLTYAKDFPVTLFELEVANA